MISQGTQGDVQYMLPLVQDLTAAGHTVTLVVFETYGKFCRDRLTSPLAEVVTVPGDILGFTNAVARFNSQKIKRPVPLGEGNLFAELNYTPMIYETQKKAAAGADLLIVVNDLYGVYLGAAWNIPVVRLYSHAGGPPNVYMKVDGASWVVSVLNGRYNLGPTINGLLLRVAKRTKTHAYVLNEHYKCVHDLGLTRAKFMEWLGTSFIHWIVAPTTIIAGKYHSVPYPTHMIGAAYMLRRNAPASPSGSGSNAGGDKTSPSGSGSNAGGDKTSPSGSGFDVLPPGCVAFFDEKDREKRPVVYIGFGSVPPHSPNLHRRLLEGAKKANACLVVQTSHTQNTDITNAQSPDPTLFNGANILAVATELGMGKDVYVCPDDQYLDHPKLFRRCAVVVHHGGLGHVATTMSVHRPMMIIPAMMDGRMMAGIAHNQGFCRHLPAECRADDVASALRFLLSPQARARADLYGHLLKTEDPKAPLKYIVERFTTAGATGGRADEAPPGTEGGDNDDNTDPEPEP